ncbi:MAG: head GIN domain-containing protein, partial [Bacteroidaceae bacterium]
MKNAYVVLAILLLISTTTSCAAFSKRIKASSTYITKDIKVSDFDAIKLMGSPTLIFNQSTDGKTKVQVYGSDNLVDLLNIRVANNTLIVHFKPDVNISYNGKTRLKVLVSSPMLKDVLLQGSGDIVLKGAIQSNSLNLSLQGSGDIKSNGNIECSSAFNAALNGSGDIELEGNIYAQTSKISLNGSGDIKMGGIEFAQASIALNGSGDINIQKHCQAKTTAVALNGSGDVQIKGIGSTTITASLQGSGDMELEGKTENANLKLQNSGNIDASNLVSNNTEASINGSGEINCHASNKLKASVSGSGEISCKGKPLMQEKLGKIKGIQTPPYNVFNKL